MEKGRNIEGNERKMEGHERNMKEMRNRRMADVELWLRAYEDWPWRSNRRSPITRRIYPKKMDYRNFQIDGKVISNEIRW